MEKQLLDSLKKFTKKLYQSEQKRESLFTRMDAILKECDKPDVDADTEKLKSDYRHWEKNKELLLGEGEMLLAQCAVETCVEDEAQLIARLFEKVYFKPFEKALQRRYHPQLLPCRYCQQQKGQLVSRAGGWTVDCELANPIAAVTYELPLCSSREVDELLMFRFPAEAVAAWNERNRLLVS